MLEANAGQPARLVLDLSATRPRQLPAYHFARNQNLAHAKLQRRRQAERGAAESLGRSSAADRARSRHGGIDNGAKAASGELEKDVVLHFATTLRARLEASGKYRVAMTRSDDTFIPLIERVRFGRAQGAQLFVSIHADAIPRSEGQAEGATVYTLSENASDAEAARLAEAENKADVIAGVDLTARA
ncbi:MAG: N-acetylmuramoyl-L-alanine amidase [Pseudolabrys sp.]